MPRVVSTFLPPVDLAAVGKEPIYRRISDWYRKAITSGLLRPGQRIPSTRALADELKVSRISVLTAYEQLFAEGYFETRAGAGTYVAQSIPDEALTPAKVEEREAGPCGRTCGAASHGSPGTGVPTLGPSWAWLKNTGALRVGLPAVQAFPNAVWSKLVAKHARKPRRELMLYGDWMGYLPFREAVAEYLRVSRAVRCEAAQIMVTTGSQAALQMCARVLFGAGDSVWMEDPGYFGAHNALRSAGVRMVPVPVDQEGLDVSQGLRLARTARAAFITPSHQFPMGAIMSATRRMQLLNWAASNGSWIVEDDYDSEFRFDGRPIASLQGLDVNDHVIYVGTLSKSMFPALRLGYMVMPEAVKSATHDSQIASFSAATMLYQAAMTDFIREGHFARHLRRTRMLYEQRCRALVDAIHEYLGDRFEVVGAAAGLQLAVLLPPESNDVLISTKAAEMGISVMPLSPQYLGKRVRSGLILGYGCANEEEIRDAVRKLRTCVG